MLSQRAQIGICMSVIPATRVQSSLDSVSGGRRSIRQLPDSHKTASLQQPYLAASWHLQPSNDGAQRYRSLPTRAVIWMFSRNRCPDNHERRDRWSCGSNLHVCDAQIKCTDSSHARAAPCLRKMVLAKEHSCPAGKDLMWFVGESRFCARD